MPYDNQEELFFHVDENDQVIGSITRGEAHADPNLIHRAVDILLSNDQDEILMQKRSENKDVRPGHWTVSASGHVTYPETYEEAAEKELQEELGLNLPLQKISTYLINLNNETEFVTLFIGNYNQTPTNFDQIEVAELRWVPLAKLAEFCENNPITPASDHIFHLLGYL